MNSNLVSTCNSAKINHQKFTPQLNVSPLWLSNAERVESLFYPVIKYLSGFILSFFLKFTLSPPIHQISSCFLGNIYDFIKFSQNAVPIFLSKNKTKKPLRYLSRPCKKYFCFCSPYFPRQSNWLPSLLPSAFCVCLYLSYDHIIW